VRFTLQRNQPGWLTGLMILALIHGAISIYQVWEICRGAATLDAVPFRTVTSVLGWVVVVAVFGILAK
jgi:hypothetical protein